MTESQYYVENQASQFQEFIGIDAIQGHPSL